MPVARLSIVIPVLGKLKKLEDTLVSVLENRPAHCEIVVVLNEPYDDPYELAGEVSFIQAPLRAKLVPCLNLGIAASCGSIIHTLGCGIEVSPNWTDSVLSHFDRSDVSAVSPWIIDRSNIEQTLSTGVGYRPGGAAWRVGYQKSIEAPLSLPKYFGPDLLAGFYRKSALEAVGGLCPQFPGHLAGVDLALALHFAEGQCVVESNCRILADKDDLLEGERLGGGYRAERLFWRWAGRMGWFRAGMGHTGLVLNECFESIVRPTNLLRLCGRAWGTFSVPFAGRDEPEQVRIENSQDSVIACPHFRQSNTPVRPREISKAS
jgi:hypothetical protein